MSRFPPPLPPGALDKPSARRLARTFAALADPTRLRLVSALSVSEQCVGDLASLVGLTPSAVSHQLRGLRQQRIVRHRKVGRTVYYALDDEHISDLLQRAREHLAHA